MDSRTWSQGTPEDPAGGRRVVRRGDFELPCRPATALPLFTPEGERDWVEGWDPAYLSGATDEVGAVWRTSHGDQVTWITVDRDADRRRYSRFSSNGTAGLVEVRCTPSSAGTRVQVTYDLTAGTDDALVALRRFDAEFDDMLDHWQQATTAVLSRTPDTGHRPDRPTGG